MKKPRVIGAFNVVPDKKLVVYEKIPTNSKTDENTNIRLLVTLLMLSGILSSLYWLC